MNNILDLINNLDKSKKILVIGHKKPDTDTIFSSYLMSNILKSLSYDAYYAVLNGEKISDDCLKQIEDNFDYSPFILNKEDIPKYNYFLTDHNDVNQSIGDASLVLGAIDHHPDAGMVKAIITNYVSTCLAIYDMCSSFYKFNDYEKKLIYIASMDDSNYGLNARYKESDKKIIKDMGFDETFNGMFEKYFTPTDMSNKEKAFKENGFKAYNFNGIKFISTYLKLLNLDYLEEYKKFIYESKENILGLYIDMKNLKTYTFLRYNEHYLERSYDFIAPRSTIVLNNTLTYLRSVYEQNI